MIRMFICFICDLNFLALGLAREAFVYHQTNVFREVEKAKGLVW
jgi:hypothetical protein